jgi:hypothetical protein
MKLDVYALLQILVAHFPANHGHVLLPLLIGNELLLWSAAHVSASWNMSKRE